LQVGENPKSGREKSIIDSLKKNGTNVRKQKKKDDEGKEGAKEGAS